MSETTNQENDIIESVEKIFSNGRIYNIPEYQRGYKWSEEDVNALLNDISNFQAEGDKFYCLQNITIKKQKDSENIYEVIDGQQRLTTLSILLSYLGETKLLKEDNKYKIQYSIRKESQSFLYELLEDSEKDYLNDKLEYINDFDTNYNSQDVFHFCLAKYTIIKFLGNDENKKENFKNKLLTNVKLIVNDVSSDNNVKGETIFKNLNSNKVALEYYDLIRAIFITRVKKEGNYIDLAEKRIKIGIDIDNMNIWWSDENVKEYFKMFSNENNISILYDLYWKCINNESNNNNEKLNAYKAQSNNEALFKYLDSNTDKAEGVFKEVVRFYNTMADWYEDKEIYHLLGFIGEHIEKDINTIWSIWEENTTRQDFKNKLKQIIKNNLIKEEDNNSDNVKELYNKYLESIKDINNYWYYRKNDTIKLLILIDIIKILQNTNHKLPANYFSANYEDIEHIFSKTPNNETTIEDAIKNINLIISLADDNKKEELINYKKTLEIHQKEIILDNIGKLKELGKLKEYREKIRDIPYIHSIGNLVLLNSKTNRGYGNASYVDKRRIIIELYEKGDKYIRNHTSSIFSKNVNEWTIDNIKNTAEDIRKEIEKFFYDNNK